MRFLQIILTSVLSVTALLIITKIIGYRQMSELSLFDYINGITIGSIAAELAFAEKDEFVYILVAMVVYGLITALLAFVTDKSIILRRLITGKPIVLMENGKLFYHNFKKARIDLNEFMMRGRNNGFFNLSEIHSAVLEPNGKISFLPFNLNKPITPNEMKMNVTQEFFIANVVIDGKIMEDNLNTIGRDKKWLINQLKGTKYDDISELFLVTCNNKGELDVYRKENEKRKDIFE